MKKMKRLLSLFLVLLMLLAGSLAASAEGSEVLEEFGLTEDTIQAWAENLVQSLSTATEADLQSAMEMYPEDDSFRTWKEVGTDAGTFEQILTKEITYKKTENGFSMVVPVKMSEKTIYISAEVDGSTQTTRFVFTDDAESSGGMGLGQIFKKAGLNTLLGMGTVFAVLIFISILIWLLGYVPKLFQPKEELPAAAPAAKRPAAAVPAALQPAADKAPSDNGELVAVIAAAIAASTGTSTDSFVVRSIRKVRRK